MALSLNRTVRYGSAYGAVAEAMQDVRGNFEALAEIAPRQAKACLD
jgi:hypothetical protein